MSQPVDALGLANMHRDALARGDLDAIKNMMSEELWKKLLQGGANSDGTVRETLLNAKSARFANVEMHDVIASNDKIAGRFSFSVSSDAFAGAKPGRHARVTGMAMARLENGKIVEIHHEIDKLGMFEQLQIVPPHLAQ